MAICGFHNCINDYTMTEEWYYGTKEKNRYIMKDLDLEPKVKVLIVNKFNNEYDMIYYKSRCFWNENSDEFKHNFYIRVIDEDIDNERLLYLLDIMPNAKVYYPCRTIMSLLSVGDRVKWELGINLMMNQ